MQAIEENGTGKLEPIKKALPPEVSYTAIRFAAWEHNNVR